MRCQDRRAASGWKRASGPSAKLKRVVGAWVDVEHARLTGPDQRLVEQPRLRDGNVGVHLAVVDHDGRSEGADALRERDGLRRAGQHRATQQGMRGDGIVDDERADLLRMERPHQHRQAAAEREANEGDTIGIDAGVALEIGQRALGILDD